MTNKIRILAIALSLASVLYGDSLVLRNGAHIPGQLISVTRGVILFATEGRNQRFNSSDVGRIEFNGPADTQGRFNSDSYGKDQHATYDQYRNRPDYRDNQPQGGAISAKYQDMSRAGLGLGQPVGAEQTSSDGQGHFRVYQNSTLYWSPATGAHEVHGSIREQYLSVGSENSRLGYPTSDEVAAPDGVGRQNNFEHGSIYWSARSGARVSFTR